jgi:hypothetical protein
MIACLICLVVGFVLGRYSGAEKCEEGISADAAQFMLDGRGAF